MRTFINLKNQYMVSGEQKMSDKQPTVKCPTCCQEAEVDSEHLLRVPFCAECKGCGATFFVFLQVHLIKDGAIGFAKQDR